MKAEPLSILSPLRTERHGVAIVLNMSVVEAARLRFLLLQSSDPTKCADREMIDIVCKAIWLGLDMGRQEMREEKEYWRKFHER